MSDIVRESFSFHDLPLQSGDALPTVTLAYVTRGKLAAVATYDATTGAPRAYYDLSSLDPGAHLANDLVLDARGNAYVTDSFAPVIYRIDTKGHASIFARDARFKTGEGFNLNGIAMHRGGYPWAWFRHGRVAHAP